MLRRTINFYSRIIVLNEIMFLLSCCNWFLVGNASNEFLLFLCPWYPRLIINFTCIRFKICNHILLFTIMLYPHYETKKNLKTNHKWG
jgi:hypothetical protein